MKRLERTGAHVIRAVLGSPRRPEDAFHLTEVDAVALVAFVWVASLVLVGAAIDVACTLATGGQI